MKKISCRIREDKAASLTIEFLLIVLILFATVVTIIDFAVYFNNRSIFYNAAGNGARLTAVLGGSQNNTISDQYSVVRMTDTCNSARGRVQISNAVACSVVEELANSGLTIAATLQSVDCGPPRTAGIGDRTYCEIRYRYIGIPGSAMSLARLVRRNGGIYTVRATAESEVVNR